MTDAKPMTFAAVTVPTAKYCKKVTPNWAGLGHGLFSSKARAYKEKAVGHQDCQIRQARSRPFTLSFALSPALAERVLGGRHCRTNSIWRPAVVASLDQIII